MAPLPVCEPHSPDRLPKDRSRLGSKPELIQHVRHVPACVCAGELYSGVLLPAAEGAVRRRADHAGHLPPLLQQRRQRDRLRPFTHLRFGGVQQTLGRQEHQPAPVYLPSPKIEIGRGGTGGRERC